MDERKLAELFQSAVRDAPPASFDDRDVAVAADRLSRRRRAQWAGGGGLVVVVLLAVGLFLGTGGFGHTLNDTALSAGGAGSGPVPQSDSDATRLGQGPFAEQHTSGGPAQRTPGFPSESPMQGGDATGKAGPGAGGTSQGCGPTDAELAVALAGELSSVGAPATTPGDVHCPTGSRSATYAVPNGTVTALLVPTAEQNQFQPAAGTSVGSARSASGTWWVIVVTQPTTPYANRVTAIQQAISAKF